MARRKRKTTDPASPRADQAEANVPSRDTMLVHGVSEDGQSLAVLRARDDRIEAGVVRNVREGEPIMGELVRLTPRAETPLLCDVEVELPAPGATKRELAPVSEQDDALGRVRDQERLERLSKELHARAQAPKLSHGGPAQVATPSYRQNWDAIWSQKKKPSAPN